MAEDITFWSARIDGTLAGCGALKLISPGHGEIKSMHIAGPWRGMGIGAKILAHIIDGARGRSLTRLSLETGSMAAFEPARRLYARHGFTICPPFAGYRDDPNSVYMTLHLAAGKSAPQTEGSHQNGADRQCDQAERGDAGQPQRGKPAKPSKDLALLIRRSHQ